MSKDFGFGGFFELRTPQQLLQKLRHDRARLEEEPADSYAAFLKGTKLLTLKEGAAIMAKGDGFKSLHGSSKIADDFNVANDVYKKANGNVHADAIQLVPAK